MCTLCLDASGEGPANAQADRAYMASDMRTHSTEQYAPDRIIIESSGSAFPATLAWQVRQLEEEGLLLDAVVSASSSLPFAYAP